MTELDQIKNLLSTSLYAGSKTWTQGSTKERVEWLLSMYESAQQEVTRLQDDLDAAIQYNFDRT